jgi:exosortase C (VPDSG-CTERM-specific)
MQIRETNSEAGPQPTLGADLATFGPTASGAAPNSSGRLKLFTAYAGLLIACFIVPLFSLFTYAARTDLHSHILLVPFISGYLLYLRRAELPKQCCSSPAIGSVFATLGIAAVALAMAFQRSAPPLSQNDHLAVMAFGFVSLLAAGGYFIFGQRWMAAAAFPLAFLIFLVPLPDAAVNFLENASMLASTEAASLLFDAASTPVLRSGTVFELPGITIQVAQECSGIRSSWVLFITGLLAANMFLRSNWRRALFVAFVIPLGIIRNGFRVWVIGTLCAHFGPEMIHSALHRRGGPLFFALSLIPLFLVLWALRRQEQRSSKNMITDVCR